MRLTQTGEIAGTAFLSQPTAKTPRRFPTGRVCRYPTCNTLLNSYNPSSWCALHDNDRCQALTRQRLGAIEVITCAQCGQTKRPNAFIVAHGAKSTICRACLAAQREMEFVPVGLVADHLAELRAAGLSWGEIARRARVAKSTPRQIANGQSMMVKRYVAEALLHVTGDLED